MSDEDIKLPYVTNPGKIREYFNKIIEVETPAKFTMNFLSDVMLFKGKNDRNLMPLLKSMRFLDDSGVPTQLYSDYKIDDLSKTTMAKGIRNAYAEIYRRKKDFDTLNDDNLKGYIKAITKLGDSSSIVPLIVRTLTNLKELADFSHNDSPVPRGQELAVTQNTSSDDQSLDLQSLLKLNYTITINLPNAGSQETYDRIFESIKKVLLTK